MEIEQGHLREVAEAPGNCCFRVRVLVGFRMYLFILWESVRPEKYSGTEGSTQVFHPLAALHLVSK